MKSLFLLLFSVLCRIESLSNFFGCSLSLGLALIPCTGYLPSLRLLSFTTSQSYGFSFYYAGIIFLGLLVYMSQRL